MIKRLFSAPALSLSVAGFATVATPSASKYAISESLTPSVFAYHTNPMWKEGSEECERGKIALTADRPEPSSAFPMVPEMFRSVWDEPVHKPSVESFYESAEGFSQVSASEWSQRRSDPIAGIVLAGESVSEDEEMEVRSFIDQSWNAAGMWIPRDVSIDLRVEDVLGRRQNEHSKPLTESLEAIDWRRGLNNRKGIHALILNLVDDGYLDSDLIQEKKIMRAGRR